MKRIVSIACCFASLGVSTLAQEKGGATAPPPITNPLTSATTATNSTASSATATNSPALASAKPSAAAVPESKEKPDIKELIKLPAFTNSTDMVMVKVSDDLWAGKYEVTQKEYQKVSGSNPSGFSGDRNPVNSVSWNDAMSFCRRLTQTEREEEMLPEGFVYTLPTQAQWESLAAGSSLKAAVTSADASRSGPAAVGSLGATGPGLYDIRGNVWELCLDPQDKPYRVARGASWDTSFEVNLRPDFRRYGPPEERSEAVGFRCVLVPEK